MTGETENLVLELLRGAWAYDARIVQPEGAPA